MLPRRSVVRPGRAAVRLWHPAVVPGPPAVTPGRLGVALTSLGLAVAPRLPRKVAAEGMARPGRFGWMGLGLLPRR
jgi:hypothetical protein